MDETQSQWLETLLRRKIMLYHDLIHCLKRERASLIAVDLDKLWALSREKEELCVRIKSIRHEIISHIYPGINEDHFHGNQILDVIVRRDRSRFHMAYLALIRVKREIEVLRKENLVFIDDSLRFLDELISIITGQNKAEVAYNNQCHLSQSGTQMLLNREV